MDDSKINDLWEVEVKGENCSKYYEISVIRKSNEHGHKSLGWFDDTKLLIAKNTHWPGPLPEKIWDKMIILAEEVAAELNAEEFGVEK